MDSYCWLAICLSFFICFHWHNYLHRLRVYYSLWSPFLFTFQNLHGSSWCVQTHLIGSSLPCCFYGLSLWFACLLYACVCVCVCWSMHVNGQMCVEVRWHSQMSCLSDYSRWLFSLVLTHQTRPAGPRGSTVSSFPIQDYTCLQPLSGKFLGIDIQNLTFARRTRCLTYNIPNSPFHHFLCVPSIILIPRPCVSHTATPAPVLMAECICAARLVLLRVPPFPSAFLLPNLCVSAVGSSQGWNSSRLKLKSILLKRVSFVARYLEYQKLDYNLFVSLEIFQAGLAKTSPKPT